MSNASAPARQVVLVVLDGWGYRPEREGNAIELARTPVWHRLWGSEPRTLLEASGLAVGLPEGQMGNSEVGHLNLGAGRVVPQDLVRISASIRSGEFYRLEPLVALCTGLRERGGTLHLLGLLGAGGVHAIDTHLLAAVEAAVVASGPASPSPRTTTRPSCATSTPSCGSSSSESGRTQWEKSTTGSGMTWSRRRKRGTAHRSMIEAR